MRIIQAQVKSPIDVLNKTTRWHLLFIGLTAIWLRLPLLGDQPYTDEGIYAAASYFAHLAYTGAVNAGGWFLPREGTLSLYPLITSWVYFLPAEPFFLLRLFDIIFAVTSGLAIYRFVLTILNDPLIALISAIIFVLAMNHPVFINAGYKNSILIAVTLTVYALTMLHGGGAKACFQAGLFVSGAVLFRETFLPMALVVALYASARCGWTGFLRFSIAGITLAFGVVATVVLLRGPGGLDGLVNSYIQYNTSIPYKTSFTSMLQQGQVASSILLPLAPLVCLGLFAFAFGSRYRNREQLEILALGVFLTLCPMLEIWLKPAFPYHFSQTMLGLTLLFALGMHIVRNFHCLPHKLPQPLIVIFTLIGFVLNLLLFHDYAQQYYWQMISAARFTPVMIAGNWKSNATESSIYLRAARFIRENSPPSATMITEYVTVGLFPLTHRIPRAEGLSNLQSAVGRSDQTANAAATRQLLDVPPDIFVLMPHSANFLNGYEDTFPQELARRYTRLMKQDPGLSPYGNRSVQIYLR